jgi:hypothetical protein
VESLIDDYISREFVQVPALLPLANDTICTCLRDREPGKQEAAHG